MTLQTHPSLDQALQLHNMGLAAIYQKGKQAFQPGWNKERNSPEKLQSEFKPGLNVAIVTGELSRSDKGCLIVIDCDVRSDDPKHKAEAWQALLALFGKVRPTTLTGGGGAHWWFWIPHDRLPKMNKLILAEGTMIQDGGKERPAWTIEALLSGHACTVPPSIHPSGKSYEWANGGPHIEDVPASLIEAIEKAQQSNNAPTAGERGDLGEKPRQSYDARGRTRGEQRRILTAAEIQAAMKRAGKALAGDPYQAKPYPVAALGALADACVAIAEGGQIAPDMVGQCLLSTAALLTQSRASVRTLAGVKPLSLYMLSIGESGDGKSTAESAALEPIRAWQRKRAGSYRAQIENAAQQAAAARKRGEAKPEIPREPYLIMRDGTVEGIRRGFRQGLPSQGVFTSEAAVMLAGYGMNPDNRANSAANFNTLWDDGEISVARGLDGRLQLYDRRLSLHWLVQSDVARSALHDPLLSNVGFWPRFIVSWSALGAPRLANPFRPEKDSRIGAYWTRCTELVTRELSDDCSGLPEIAASAEAEQFACRFFERMEQAAKTAGGLLEGIRPFALRATEQMFRTAGVLAAFAGEATIDLDAMRGAAALAGASLETWRAIYGDRDEAEAGAHALTLYGWMLRQPRQSASTTAILKIGPKALRSQSRRDTALALLEQARLAERERDTWYAHTGGEP